MNPHANCFHGNLMETKLIRSGKLATQNFDLGAIKAAISCALPGVQAPLDGCRLRRLSCPARAIRTAPSARSY